MEAWPRVAAMKWRQMGELGIYSGGKANGT